MENGYIKGPIRWSNIKKRFSISVLLNGEVEKGGNIRGLIKLNPELKLSVTIPSEKERIYQNG